MKAFVEKKDILARIGNEVKNVAIYADNLSKEQAKPMRVLGSEQMSDDENRLARKAICMSQMLGDLSIRAMVRNDNELDEKVNKLLRSSNKVLFGILLSEKCNDNELKAYDANLDFTEADIMELRKAYAI